MTHTGIFSFFRYKNRAMIKADLTEIKDEILEQAAIRLLIKREELNRPFPEFPAISGNKWRKLKYNLAQATQENQTTLLTFGGAYSNHIHATAAAGKAMGFQTIGMIRGEETLPLNPTLTFAKEQGMQLFYLDRQTYRKKHEAALLTDLKERFGRFYLLPEGGTNQLALKGCAEMIDEIKVDFDVIACACGTGGTFAGIVQGLKGTKQGLAFSALKGNFLIKEIKQLLGENNTYENWQLQTDYHFGGYARSNETLLDFIKHFKTKHNILLDPIYTGKLIFGIFDLVKKNYFAPKTTIIAIHTGGLQAWDGFKK